MINKKPALLLCVLLSNALNAQELSFYEYNGSVGSKITNNTLLAGQIYVLGIDSKINDQRSSLLAQGYTEVVNTTRDSRFWSFPNNSFWLNSGLGGYNLTPSYLNFGNGYIMDNYGSGHFNHFSWLYSSDNSFGYFHDNNAYNPPQKDPNFDPLNFTSPIVYNSQGSYTLQFIAGGGFTIWNGSPSTRYENPVSISMTVNVVPEPSSLFLFLAGGAVLIVRRRYKR